MQFMQFQPNFYTLLLFGVLAIRASLASFILLSFSTLKTLLLNTRFMLYCFPSYNLCLRAPVLAPVLVRTLPFAAFVPDFTKFLSDRNFCLTSVAIFSSMYVTHWIFSVTFHSMNPIDVAKNYFGAINIHTKENCPFFKDRATTIASIWQNDREQGIVDSLVFRESFPSSFSALSNSDLLAKVLEEENPRTGMEALFLDIHEMYISYLLKDTADVATALVTMQELHPVPGLSVFTLTACTALTSLFIAKGLILASSPPGIFGLLSLSVLTSPLLLSAVVPLITNEPCLFEPLSSDIYLTYENPYLTFDEFFEDHQESYNKAYFDDISSSDDDVAETSRLTRLGDL